MNNLDRKREEQLIEAVVIFLYEMKFLLEDYATADYINGRHERAMRHYLIDSIFHARVNTAVAWIGKIYGR